LLFLLFAAFAAYKAVPGDVWNAIFE
jgi:hypothetical protein